MDHDERFDRPPAPARPQYGKIAAALLASLVLFALVAFEGIWYYARSHPPVPPPPPGPAPDVVAGVMVDGEPLVSPAYRAGLRSGDVIVAYDGEIVGSDISYNFARDRRARQGEGEVELTVRRGSETLKLKAPTGKLGFDVKDCRVLMRQICTRIDAGKPDEAERLLGDGMRAGQLVHAEELVVRIWMIPDDAVGAEAARRDKLVDEIVSMSQTDELGGYAHDYFLTYYRYEAASILGRKFLAEYPDDVSARLNLGMSEALANHFDDAERDVQRVLEHEDRVSPYGHSVAYTVLGYVELGRNHYSEATRYLHDAIDLRDMPGDVECKNRYLIAAANVGMDAFRAARGHVTSVEPPQSDFLAGNAKIIECYALDINGDHDGAVHLASAYPKRLSPKIVAEMKEFRQGADLLARWDALRS